MTIISASYNNTAAQVLQMESFESSIFPSPGWQTLKSSGGVSGLFSQVSNPLTNPNTTAALGTKAVMFNCATASVNDTAYFISKPYDLSNCQATNPVFQFQMYRDIGFPSATDRIEVFVNTAPSVIGAIPVNHNGGNNIIHRYYNLPPTAIPNWWITYSFTLNAATYNNGPKKVYVILMAIAKGGSNIYIDDFRMNTYPSPMLPAQISMDIFSQNTAEVAAGSTDQNVIGVRCVAAAGSGNGSPVAGTSVRIDTLLFTTIGTTSLSDIKNAKVWYTGGYPFFNKGYISPYPANSGYPAVNYGSTIATPATYLPFVNGSTCFHLEYDTTYFWLTYDIASSAISNNHVDAEFAGAVLSQSNPTCPTPGSSPVTPAITTQFSIPGYLTIGLPYGIPGYTIGGTNWASYPNTDYIQRVEFLTADAPSYINTYVNSVALQKASSPCYPLCPFVGIPPFYELWTNIPGQTAIITQGNTYTFRAQCGPWFTNNFIQAWIDFNHDGDFMDAGEMLAPVLTNLSANAWQNFTFTVPANGYTGTTRMRVREVYGVSNIDPVATYTYGETEDFYVTVRPVCFTGYSLWLGYGDDWNKAENWCGNLPLTGDSVRIDKASVPGVNGRPYYHPVIKNGVKAHAGSLFLSSSDTVVINAALPGDTALMIHRNFYLNGKLLVANTYSDDPFTGDRDIENFIYTPFRGQASESRTQMLVSAEELSTMGLVTNDKINAIRFSIYNSTTSGYPGKNSTQPYSGFTVSYGLTSGSSDQFTGNAPLSTPYTVFGPAAYSTTNGENVINLSAPVIWDGSSSLVLQFCFDNTTGSGNDLIHITPTTGRRTMNILSASNNANPGCVLNPGAGVNENFFNNAAHNRPNFIFDVSRNYAKPLIAIRGDLYNNGVFSAGDCRVIMDSSMNQVISGNESTTFHELEISKSNSAKVTLERPVTVNDTLFLNSGSLVLNKKSITISNPNGTNAGNPISTFAGPVSRNAGFIISEDSLSKVIWNTNNAITGSGLFRVIPFANNAGDFIPFSFRQTAGNLGLFSVSTYAVTPQNLPYPPTVFHMNDTGVVVADNSLSAVNRFWITSKGNATATTDLAFRWSASEKSGLSPAFNPANNPPRAYPWRLSSNYIGTWLKIYTTPSNPAQLMVASPFTQTNNSGFDSVVVRGFNWPSILAGNAPWSSPQEPMPDYIPWAVAGSSNTGVLGNGSQALNLKLFIAGYYAGNHMMNAVLDPAGRPTICDSIEVILASANAPYAPLSVRNTVLYTNGTALVDFPASLIGSSCYIVIRHRNSLETWSKVPLLIKSDGLIYDFTH